MAGDVVQRQPRKKGGIRRRKRRIGVRIDMTPMVDIAFLLLIFYMVTTVFSMPQAMEINLPPDDTPVKVKAVMSIRVDAEGRYWWNMGQVLPTNLPKLLPSENSDSLGGLIVNQNLKDPNLNTVVLIHRDAPFKAMVDILDEIELAERTINLARAEKYGVEIDELPDTHKFSYRYAMDEWKIEDDRAIEFALALVEEGGQ